MKDLFRTAYAAIKRQPFKSFLYEKVLKSFAKVSTNACARVYFQQICRLLACNLIKKRPRYRYFHQNFLKFSSTAFWQNIPDNCSKGSIFGVFLVSLCIQSKCGKMYGPEKLRVQTPFTQCNANLQRVFKNNSLTELILMTSKYLLKMPLVSIHIIGIMQASLDAIN